jgi:hypothetical protein
MTFPSAGIVRPISIHVFLFYYHYVTISVCVSARLCAVQPLGTADILSRNHHIPNLSSAKVIGRVPLVYG